MEAQTITDRTGRTIPQELIDKATHIAKAGITVEAPRSLWRVEGDTASYLVALDSTGASSCRCKWGTETHALCSHVMAVWVYQRAQDDSVHVNKIDGPKRELRAVPDDPFEGL